MVRITAVAKIGMRQIRKLQFVPKNTLRRTLCLQIENTVGVVYIVCAMSKMIVSITVTIFSMVRIIGVYILYKLKCAKQTSI